MKIFGTVAKRAILVGVTGFMGLLAAEPAVAQLYFRPFFRPFAYTYQDYPVEDEGPAPYASRRAVASILAREGYRLTGPLGHRGEQIVAIGFSRRDGEMRFIVDPYEGRIIRGVRIGPPPEFDRAPVSDEEYVPTLNGSRPVVRELDRDSRAERPRRERRAARPREERLPQASRTEPEPPSNVTANPSAARTATQAKPVELAVPAPKPAQAAATPVAVQPAKPDVQAAEKPAEKPARIVYPAPAQSAAPAPNAAPATTAKAEPPKAKPENTTVVAKPAPAAATPTQPSMPKTANAGGGSSHRAIVPPTSTPASPLAPGAH